MEQWINQPLNSDIFSVLLLQKKIWSKHLYKFNIWLNFGKKAPTRQFLPIFPIVYCINFTTFNLNNLFNKISQDWCKDWRAPNRLYIYIDLHTIICVYDLNWNKCPELYYNCTVWAIWITVSVELFCSIKLYCIHYVHNIL